MGNTSAREVRKEVSNGIALPRFYVAPFAGYFLDRVIFDKLVSCNEREDAIWKDSAK